MRPYPDVEAVVRFVLITLPNIAQVGRNMPEDDEVSATNAHVRVRLVEGTEELLNFYPVVRVEVFAQKVDQAKKIAADIAFVLSTETHHVSLGDRMVSLPRARVLKSPSEVPYDDSKLRRWEATYEWTIRR